MFEKEDRVRWVPRARGRRRWYDPHSGMEARVLRTSTCYVDVEWLDPYRPEAGVGVPPAWYQFQPPVQNKFGHERFELVERKAGPW